MKLTVPSARLPHDLDKPLPTMGKTDVNNNYYYTQEKAAYHWMQCQCTPNHMRDHWGQLKRKKLNGIFGELKTKYS